MGRWTWLLKTLSRGGETTASLSNFWKPELIRVPGHARWRRDAGRLTLRGHDSPSAPGAALSPLRHPASVSCTWQAGRQAGRQAGASVFPDFYPRRPASACASPHRPGSVYRGPWPCCRQPWATPGPALTARPLTHVSLGPRASSSVRWGLHLSHQDLFEVQTKPGV